MALSQSSCSIDDDCKDPDGILIRSTKLEKTYLNNTLKAISRAGAGFNNIPIDICSEKGIVVFNTPGANANAVKVLFKGDGTIHAADTSWATSLDTEDDIMALRMLDKSVSTKGVINSAWDDMIGTDWEYLQNIGVAGSTNKEKGRPDMFSMQGTVKLNMGATWYLAQNFMGSNNINILDPIGQFGTRLQGGKDSAQPRYIHTKLTELN